MFKKDQLVTVRLEENNNASNTFMVYGHVTDEDGDPSDAVILYHPMCPEIMIVRHIDQLNKVAANLKDSTERALNFTVKFADYLDHNTKGDLEALRLFFVVRRALTNRQKNQLSNICGTIASIYFHNDISLASKYVIQNASVLDEFNTMWYHNFKDLLLGKKPIVSPKQRASIFNIAGFVLAELESQKFNR